MRREPLQEQPSGVWAALSLADRGTIFLDEVGELPARLRLLSCVFLQEHEFERVGGNQPFELMYG